MRAGQWRHIPPKAPERKDDGRKKGKCMGTGSTERKAAEKMQTTLAQECQNQSRGQVSEGQTQGV